MPKKDNKELRNELMPTTVLLPLWAREKLKRIGRENQRDLSPEIVHRLINMTDIKE